MMRARSQLLTASLVGAVAMAFTACSNEPSRDSAPSQPQPSGESTSIETPTAPSIHFTDVTRESGIDFTTTCGVTPATQILEVNGCGLALFDFDRDGDLDVFISNGATLSSPSRGPGCRLYRNDGELKFSDVTATAGINVTNWANGVAVGDVNGDGFEDVFIACWGPDVLLRNNGDGTFADVSQPAGIAGESSWGASAAFGDLDNDGDLDLYVANYLEFDPARPPARTSYKNIEVMGGPHGLKPQPDFLYLNDGGGVFREASRECSASPSQSAFGLNVVILDFDDDGRQDICVANDSMADFLFINDGVRETGGPPAFSEIGVVSGIGSNGDGGNQASMGIAVADVDGNGRPDKFISVFSSDTNTLHLNVNGRLFEDRSTSFGLGIASRPYLGWACGFFDFDLDADEDLLVFNGHVYPEATMQTMESDFEQAPLLFARDGAKFRKVDSKQAGEWLAQMHRDRAAAFGDLDGDGDVDVVVSELNGPIRVLRNDAARSSSRWLMVELRDDRAGSRNHDALGAKVELRAGERVITRWLHSGGGFQSSSPPMAHFGLGGVSEPLSLRIRWPDGSEQSIVDVQPNQRLVVKRE